MVKDEEVRAPVTLNSALPHVDEFVVYDTGSTDRTLEIIADFEKTCGKPFHLLQSKFVDFSTSRNKMLDYADTFCGKDDFMLLLDSNDELRVENTTLRGELEKVPQNILGVMAYSYWEHGTDKNILSHIKFLIIRALHNVRYIARVHEYLIMNGEEFRTYYYINGVSLFQNRDFDDAKTAPRHIRDVELLLQEIKDGNKIRAFFYLSKTLISMGRFEDAIPYLKRRTKAVVGDIEEAYNSYLFLGIYHYNKCLFDDIPEVKNIPDDKSQPLAPVEQPFDKYLKYKENKKHHHKAIKYLSNAYSVMQRIDPIIYLAEYYSKLKKWNISNIYTTLAINMKDPKNAHSYNFKFYHFNNYLLHAIVCFNLRKFKEGLKALKVCENYSQGINPSDKERLTMIKGYYNASAFMLFETGARKLNGPADEHLMLKTEKIYMFAYDGEYDPESLVTKYAEIISSTLGSGTLSNTLGSGTTKVVIVCNVPEIVVYNGITYIPLCEYEIYLDEHLIYWLVVFGNAGLIKYKNVANVSFVMENVIIIGNLSMRLDRFRSMICKNKYHHDMVKNTYPQTGPYLRILSEPPILVSKTNTLCSDTTKKSKMQFAYVFDPADFTSASADVMVNLLRIFKKIKDKYPEATLKLLIDLSRKYEALQANIDATTTAIKECSGATIIDCRIKAIDVQNLMEESEYWLYPNATDSIFVYESLVAQACNVHCIYYNSSSLPYTMGQNGWLVSAHPNEPKNDDAYLDIIKKIKNNPKAANKKLKKQKAYVAEETVQKYANELLTLIL